MSSRLLPLAFVIVFRFAMAQTPAVIGGGYTVPSYLSVAPGQLITIFAIGVGKHLTSQPLTAAAPLPVTLGGLTVTLRQASGLPALQAPIVAAVLTDTCQSLRNTPCDGAKIAAITIQIPQELAVSASAAVGQMNEALLNVQEDGVSTADFLVRVVLSNPHFITGRGPMALDYILDPTVHGAAVFHADGSPVAPGLPARPGESVVVYGYGFGQLMNTIATGQASDRANPVTGFGSVVFSTLLPAGDSGALSAAPRPFDAYISYIGATPNAVGVYQMNFTIPAVPPNTPACEGTTDWNFAVTVTGVVSSASFAFCVQP